MTQNALALLGTSSYLGPPGLRSASKELPLVVLLYSLTQNPYGVLLLKHHGLWPGCRLRRARLGPDLNAVFQTPVLNLNNERVSGGAQVFRQNPSFPVHPEARNKAGKTEYQLCLAPADP